MTLVAVACAVPFAALAVYLWSAPDSTAIESHISDAITSTHKDTAFRTFDAISATGSTGAVAFAAVALAVFAWSWWRNLRLALVCVLGPALGGLGVVVLKEVIGRPRPLTAALSRTGGFGFPSGHATGAAALTAVVVLIAFAAFPRRHPARAVVVLVVVVWASAIGVSRIVIGVHLAFDVVGGALLGTIATLSAILVLRPERAPTRQLTRSTEPQG